MPQNMLGNHISALWLDGSWANQWKLAAIMNQWKPFILNDLILTYYIQKDCDILTHFNHRLSCQGYWSTFRSGLANRDRRYLLADTKANEYTYRNILDQKMDWGKGGKERKERVLYSSVWVSMVVNMCMRACVWALVINSL